MATIIPAPQYFNTKNVSSQYFLAFEGGDDAELLADVLDDDVAN